MEMLFSTQALAESFTPFSIEPSLAAGRNGEVRHGALHGQQSQSGRRKSRSENAGLENRKRAPFVGGVQMAGCIAATQQRCSKNDAVLYVCK
jgi:hypothetical protein